MKREQPDDLGNPQMGWGSDTIAEMLRRLDIPFISLVPGASYRGLHDSIVNYLGNAEPAMVVTLHEEHAVAIAHGYAKVTEKPMAVALHSNVGLMHATMGIFNAWCDRAPMLVLGATGPVDTDHRRPWIDWLHTSQDQGALIRDFTKWDDQPASVPAALESLLRANSIAQTGPRGPVYICLDVDLQERALEASVTFPDIARFQPPRAPAPAEDTVREAAAMLSTATRGRQESCRTRVAERGSLARPHRACRTTEGAGAYRSQGRSCLPDQAPASRGPAHIHDQRRRGENAGVRRSHPQSRLA